MSKESSGTAALIAPEIAAAVQKIVEENSDQIEFNPAEAKEGFEKITKALGAENKIDEAGLAEIRKIGNESEDSGLKVFAKAVANVLELNETVLSDKSPILNSLKENFNFLGEEKDPETSKTKISRLILEAVEKKTSSYEGNQGVVDAVNSGFQEAFSGLLEEVKKEITVEKDKTLSSPPNEEEGKLSPEKRREIEDQNRDFWNSAMAIMPDAAKAATALTLALAIPPPIGIILALGFLAYTWNMGHEPGEKKPDIYNDPEVQSYADAWKEFVKPELQQAIKKGDITNTGKAASVLVETAKGGLDEDGKTLKQVKSSLGSVSGNVVTSAGIVPNDLVKSLSSSLGSSENVAGGNIDPPNAPGGKLGGGAER